MKDGKGYLFPTPVDPGDMYCFKVYVPKHALYLGAFWGAYTFFATWIAWARDPLKQGRQVADVWRRAIDRAREEFELTGGECMSAIYDIRLNPLDPCEIQVKYEGDPKWYNGVFLNKCGEKNAAASGAVRYNGTTIQQYDPCSNTWVDVGPATQTGTARDEPGQYPGNPCGHGLAGGNLAQVLEDSKNKMCSLLGGLASFSEIAITVLQTIAAFVGIVDTPLFVGWLSGAWSYLGAHYTDVAAFDLTEHLTPVLAAYFNTDGSITAENYAAMVQRLKDLSDDAGPLTTEHTAYGYAYSWVGSAGQVGVVKASRAGNVTDVDCDTLEWVEVIDFTKEQGGWSSFTENTTAPQGRWVLGEGWHSSYFKSNPENADYHDFHLLRQFPQSWQMLACYVTLENVSIGTLEISAADHRIAYNSNTLYAEDHTNTADLIRFGASGSPVTVNELQLDSLVGYRVTSNGTDPGGTSTMTKIEIRGVGYNPFR